MKGIIDRFEGEFAVVETAQGNINIPKKYLFNASEGDVIEFTNDIHNVWNITVLPEETKKRTEKIDKLIKDLFQN